MTIRPAIRFEAAAILQLTLDAYAPYRDRLHPPSGVFHETVADVVRAIDEGTIFVALADGGALVGAARVRAAESDPVGAGGVINALYCGRLAVRPGAQRRGIGAALMERVEQYAHDGGYRAVVLGVRLELLGNLDAYGARGYRAVSQERHPGYATPTFVWMRKDL